MKHRAKFLALLILSFLIASSLLPQNTQDRSILLTNSKNNKSRTIKSGEKIKIKLTDLDEHYDKGKFTLPSQYNMRINDQVIPIDHIDAIWHPNKGSKIGGTILIVGGGLLTSTAIIGCNDCLYPRKEMIISGVLMTAAGMIISSKKQEYNLQEDWSLTIE